MLWVTAQRTFEHQVIKETDRPVSLNTREISQRKTSLPRSAESHRRCQCGGGSNFTTPLKLPLPRLHRLPDPEGGGLRSESVLQDSPSAPAPQSAVRVFDWANSRNCRINTISASSGRGRTVESHREETAPAQGPRFLNPLGFKGNARLSSAPKKKVWRLVFGFGDTPLTCSLCWELK